MTWQITLSPSRMNEPSTYEVAGDVLIVDGEPFDFGPLPEGATLPREAVGAGEDPPLWLLSPVERLGRARAGPLGRRDAMIDWSQMRTPEDKAAEAAACALEVAQAEARAFLASTDWYVARKVETDKPIPADVLEAREAARVTLSTPTE